MNYDDDGRFPNDWASEPRRGDDETDADRGCAWLFIIIAFGPMILFFIQGISEGRL